MGEAFLTLVRIKPAAFLGRTSLSLRSFGAGAQLGHPSQNTSSSRFCCSVLLASRPHVSPLLCFLHPHTREERAGGGSAGRRLRRGWQNPGQK